MPWHKVTISCRFVQHAQHDESEFLLQRHSVWQQVSEHDGSEDPTTIRPQLPVSDRRDDSVIEPSTLPCRD